MDDAKALDYYKDPENQIPAGPAYRRKAERLSSTMPVRFPQEVIAAVKRLAELDGMTVSSWIRHVVAKEIKRRQPAVTVTASAEHADVEIQGAPLSSSTPSTVQTEMLIAC